MVLCSKMVKKGIILAESKKCAWQFVSDFIEEDLSKKLATILKIDLEDKSINSKPAKKAKLEKNAPQSTGPKDDFAIEYNKSASKSSSTESPASTKQKALAKSAVGTKSITSFFTKK